MNVAKHAERILAAWHMGDADKFENEIENALRRCQKNDTASILDIEQQELLESVVMQFRVQTTGDPRRRYTSPELIASFALLQHLSHRAFSPEPPQSAGIVI